MYEISSDQSFNELTAGIQKYLSLPISHYSNSQKKNHSIPPSVRGQPWSWLTFFFTRHNLLWTHTTTGLTVSQLKRNLFQKKT